MKKTLKGYLLGVVTTALLVSGVAYAANSTTLYDVVTNGIKIVVDGTKLNPTDANGNRVEPFIYNGTTYLPVRAVADALGKEVYWDGPNYTVYLGKMNGMLEYPSVEIEDMVSIADRVEETDMLTDNYGNTYDRAICNAYDHTEMQYLCNMKYSRIKGTLYIPQGETRGGSVYLTVIADGKSIYKSPAMTKTSAPVDVDVNITGYNDVQLQFSDYATTGSIPKLCFGNAGFYQ